MSSPRRGLLVSLTALSVLLLGGSESRAQSPGTLAQDAAHCQQQVGKLGQKFKKAELKAWQKCLDGVLTGKGCDATARDRAITAAADRYVANVGRKCTTALLFGSPPAGIGFSSSCDLEAGPVEPVEAQCRALTVDDPTSLTRCLICWKEAELRELLQILYPCLASQVPTASGLDCGTPPAACPTDQARILCSRAIAEAGIIFLLAKEKAVEQCLDGMRNGKVPGPCPDAVAQGKIAAAEQKKVAQIGKCTQVPPWWNVCPEDPTAACDQSITSVADIATCVDGAAEEIADELVCQQYPGAAADGIACPPGETIPTSCPTSGSFSFLTKWGAGVLNGQFSGPTGVAVDGNGNVFVADSGNNRIEKFTNTGTFLTTWGGEGSGDGQFADPLGVAVDLSGNVFVTDAGNNRIQKFTNTGTFLTMWGSFGNGDGQFRLPIGVAVDGSGNVYVADYGNQRIQKFDNTGTFLTTLGSSGIGDGQIDEPIGVAVDGSGDVFVAQSFDGRIQKFDSTGTFLTAWVVRPGTPNGVAVDGSGNVFVVVEAAGIPSIRKFDNNGTFLTTWGTAGSGNFPPLTGVAVDGSGNVFFADFDDNRIQKFTNTGTFVITWGSGSRTGDGQFNGPKGVAVDGNGYVYVADAGNHRIQKFTNTGSFLTTWGAGQFVGPSGVAVDGSGNVYVADSDVAHTIGDGIQKFTNTGTFLTTWDSSGVPTDVAADGSGNVFVTAEQFTCFPFGSCVLSDNRVQKFTNTGTFLITWGSLGSGDGQFATLTGVAVDRSGNVFVVDSGNNRIQKFDNSGTFLTTWGSPGSGDGQFSGPTGVAVDGSSNVYVVDSGNNRIQRFTNTGSFLTTWGSPGSGDGQFSGPTGVAVDESGSVFVADSGNNRIEKFACP